MGLAAYWMLDGLVRRQKSRGCLGPGRNGDWRLRRQPSVTQGLPRQETICIVFEGPPDSKSTEWSVLTGREPPQQPKGQIDSKGRGMAPGVDVGSLTYWRLALASRHVWAALPSLQPYYFVGIKRDPSLYYFRVSLFGAGLA